MNFSVSLVSMGYKVFSDILSISVVSLITKTSKLYILPINKNLDGKEVSRFDSVIVALLITDMKSTELFGLLNDGTEDSNGFSWQWV